MAERSGQHGNDAAVTAEGAGGPGPLSNQPANSAPPEAPAHEGAAKQAEAEIKPSSPGETGTTPGTNWRK